MWNGAREEILKSSDSSSVYIGCDSQIFARRNKKTAKTEYYSDYVTVIVVHKDSRHGCKIFYSTETMRDYGQRDNRLLAEVQQALAAYEHIKDVIGNRHLEVHLDVNPDPRFASNSVAAQALGWVRGMGLEAKIKPDSWAATHAADHVVRRKSLFKN